MRSARAAAAITTNRGGIRPSGEIITPFFTVVIPVYNVQQHLVECIDSVVSQTLEQIEVVLVDDGSTDGSSAICDAYASRDRRVRVIHKQNGGLSSARNAGIRVAVGEYLLFVDGDDYYDDSRFLEDLRDRVMLYDGPDMLLFGWRTFCESSRTFQDDGAALDECLNGLDVVSQLASMIASDSLSVSAGLRAVRRPFLVERGLLFREGTYSEDVDWSLRVFDRVSRIALVNSRPYIYRKGRAASITSNIGGTNVSDGIAILEGYANDFEYASEELRRTLLGYVAYQYCVFCGLSARLRGEERIDSLDRLRDLRWLLGYGASAKVGLVRRVDRILGFGVTARILGLYIGLGRP